MRFIRLVCAEVPLLPARLVRSRLGFWLLMLLGGLWWLQRRDPAADPVGIAVLAGTLGAVLCVAGLAGSKSDRAALAHRLLHPTTPGAIASGRWLAAVGGSAAVVLVLVGHAAWTTGAGTAAVALAGLAAAAAASAWALALVLAGGSALAVLAFLWLLLVSPMPPEAMLGLGQRGLASLIGAWLLELGPSVWRYRGIATGDLGATAHAVAWVVFGLTVAMWRVTRLGARPL